LQQALQRFSEAVEKSGVDIVPRMVINNGGAADGSTSNAFEALMAMLLSEKLGINLTGAAKSDPNPETRQFRDSILKGLNQSSAGSPNSPTNGQTS
jgi:hypothetical protein